MRPSPRTGVSVSLVKYLKAAFLNRWNLLAFLGAMGFALLGGHPDVALPMVLAVELAYLGLLGTHPKFQKYVEAREATARRSKSAQTSGESLNRIFRTLPPEVLARFTRLRNRCLELQQIAAGLKHPDEPTAARSFEESQQAGLDRLLWMFLRLLYTQHGLNRFLEKTDENAIREDVQELQERLAHLPPAPQGIQEQRIRKALEANLATSQERLENYRKAADNLQLVELQLDQLENRIQSLSEMAVNRQEPEFISQQVDLVATSMRQTEDTISELRFATELDTFSDEAPALLRPVDAQVIE